MFVGKSRVQLLRAAASPVAAAFLVACAGQGGAGGLMMPAGNSAASNGSGNTIVRIHVPPGYAAASGPTGNAPVASPPMMSTVPGAAAGSASSGSLSAPVPAAPAASGAQTLAINVTGPMSISQAVAIGPNATGCSPSAGGTLCQANLQLAAGSYTGTIAPYASGSSAAASELAPPSAIAFTVAPGANTVVNLTLSAVPAELAIVPASLMSGVNSQGGIDLYGAGKHALLVELLDANNNVIIGGAPASFSISPSGGSLPLAVSQTATIAPNLFYVTAPASAGTSTATLRATVTYLGAANPCAQGGAECSSTTRVDVRQILAVANSNVNTVTLYVNGQSAPLTTLQSAVADPQALIFDALGDLFIANQPGSISEYAPPYAGVSPTIINNSINHPQALAIDAHGNLFVANGNGSNTITLYAPPYTGGPSTSIVTGINDPVGVALDGATDLFVANAAADTVTEYAPPYNRGLTTISKGLNAPNSLALDGRGNLFVTNLNATPNSVVEYTPPFSNASVPVATITNGVNEQGSIGLSTSANLFVPNQGANTVTEYIAPYTGTPTTIVGGQSQPVALAIDALNNLYVANYGNNSVTEYPPPYVAAQWATISNGVSAPQALALSPPTSVSAALVP
jgi:hypothetical protein